MTVIETMRAEWHLTLKQSLRESIPAALALWPALITRHGGEWTGMDPVTRARQIGKAKARAWLAANYDIQPSPAKQLPLNPTTPQT